MQLLTRADAPDFDTWKQAFDDSAEDHRNAGLTLLQLWRDADGAGSIFALFEVNDRDKAQNYLRGAYKLMSDKAGATVTKHHFLDTA